MRWPGAIVFFGTPRFALPSLEALCAAGGRPGLVVTQPSRAAGRGRALRESPVAELARRLELPVVAVPSVKGAEFLRSVGDLEPWAAVVVAYGQILPPALLEVPTVGGINVHASLLPKYRGAAPIQAAVAAGDRVTGVTTMRMTAGLDEGPILRQREVGIGAEETAPELAERLAAHGASLLVETLDGLAAGSLAAREQDAAQASYAPRLDRRDGRVDWELEAAAIFNRWRAFVPWPGITTRLAGADLKIVACRPATIPVPRGSAPGRIVATDPDLVVACGSGSALVIEVVQRPGRRAVSARDLVNGERLRSGDVFTGTAVRPGVE